GLEEATHINHMLRIGGGERCGTRGLRRIDEAKSLKRGRRGWAPSLINGSELRLRQSDCRTCRAIAANCASADRPEFSGSADSSAKCQRAEDGRQEVGSGRRRHVDKEGAEGELLHRAGTDGGIAVR